MIRIIIKQPVYWKARLFFFFVAQLTTLSIEVISEYISSDQPVGWENPKWWGIVRGIPAPKFPFLIQV